MNDTGTYLAVFVGDKDSARMKAWMAQPEAERRAKEREGMHAWQAWMQTHADALVAAGGPLGRTKRVDGDGVHDVSNTLGGFTVVRAASHEAAAKLFENHPQFTIFPGEGVEVMPVLSIPGA